MKDALNWTLLLACLALCGCKSTAQEYVQEHSGGNFEVRGEIQTLDGVTTDTWEHLSDGFAVTVDDPGCRVTISQMVAGKSTGKKTTFNLVKGDHIVIGEDNHYVLSSLDQNQANEEAQEAKTAAEQEPAGGDEGAGEGEPKDGDGAGE